NNKGTIDNIICSLGSAFVIKDLGPLNYFMGIEIVLHMSGILLSQKKYILELLQSVGLSKCNLVSSPMVTSSSLSLDYSIAFSKYQQVVRIIGNPDTSLEAFSDADWARDLDDRRSSRGFAIYLAEYKAFDDTVAELTWLKALLNELRIRSSLTLILWCDNLEEILKRAHMQNYNPCRTPVDTESKLGSDGDPVSNLTLYCSLAGSLHYLTFTCPDLSYAVQHLHVSCTTQLSMYTNADWVGCPITYRSTSGYYVFLGDNILSWSAKHQVTLSRSSAKTKYRGVANVVVETLWIRNLLCELHTPQYTATLVYCDNVSAVYMSSNPVKHQCTKHIEIDIHFVRDFVALGQVRVLHVHSRFHDEFRRSFGNLIGFRLKKQVLNILLKLSSGWRPKNRSVCGHNSNEAKVMDLLEQSGTLQANVLLLEIEGTSSDKKVR
nr:ribonuclease H-like domain-containing protein [Tanacetum cinerariifolium]